jgi:Spy/CpxP family protein refolding chaperone
MRSTLIAAITVAAAALALTPAMADARPFHRHHHPAPHHYYHPHHRAHHG